MGDGSAGAGGRAKSRARVGSSTKAGAIILKIKRASEMPLMMVVVEVVRVVSGLLSTARRAVVAPNLLILLPYAFAPADQPKNRAAKVPPISVT